MEAMNNNIFWIFRYFDYIDEISYDDDANDFTKLIYDINRNFGFVYCGY